MSSERELREMIQKATTKERYGGPSYGGDVPQVPCTKISPKKSGENKTPEKKEKK